ncbi:hypothetical protein EPUL_003922 [Erysiphe pulchra]|uniref:Uncharacterized protein n=1 Tax=Erysiphe pulchra TaxID=225359 RepID=A0A2S4PPW8_9PEZI|nr:hypothetical protein EPUL_003922 [Erysiphe pulchra]
MKSVEGLSSSKTTVTKNNSWAARATNGNYKVSNNPIRAPPARPTAPQEQGYKERRIMFRLAPTPAKAATTLQYKDLIANRFKNATVVRQQSWKTFLVGPLPKQITTLDGPQDPLDGLILQEPGPASIQHNVPIRQIAWKIRSKKLNDDFRHVRIPIPAHKAHRFPLRLQLLGLAVGI